MTSTERTVLHAVGIAILYILASPIFLIKMLLSIGKQLDAIERIRGWRAASWTFKSELYLARKEHDLNAPCAPFFTLPVCVLPCILISVSPAWTTRVDRTHVRHSVRLNDSSTSSSATLCAGVTLWMGGACRRPENLVGTLGPMRSRSIHLAQTKRSGLSSDSLDSTSAKRRQLSSSHHPAGRRSNGQHSHSSRREAAPLRAMPPQSPASAAQRFDCWSSGARSGPSSSPEPGQANDVH
jgi:hypothetical protein